VKGSRALSTASLGAPSPVARAEALEPGELLRVPVGGDLLGAVRVRARFVPIPLDAFDRASARLAAGEQAAYLHLLRLSYGEGRNFARAGKRDLMARLGLSERRLLRVLAALVEKGFARPVHRDNRGTLWRVLLPCEAAGETPGDDVLLGRAAATGAPRRDAPAPRPGRPRGPVSVRGLAAALARARGLEPAGAALEVAGAEVAGLLEDGCSPARVEAAIRAVARRSGCALAAGEDAP
jgi:hypothetical protein